MLSLGATSAVAVSSFVAAWALVGVAISAALVPLVAAGDVDRRESRLPDRLVLLGAVPVVTVAAVAVVVTAIGPTGAHSSDVASVALGAASLAAPIGALHLVSPRAMGFGDVKAAAVLGLAVGLVDHRLSLVVVCAASAAAAAWGLARRRLTVPFGPFLVAATVAVLTAASWSGLDAAIEITGAMPWR